MTANHTSTLQTQPNTTAPDLGEERGRSCVCVAQPACRRLMGCAQGAPHE